ncbi:hypothetical protein QWY14_15530 [Planococcus sp. N028]|uniref:DUF3955 domain-containing protein n=1 Tax=Planococcus shixiaomingii TaxID=3058393 RepID=A0ABT8N6P1_9BACL|nr:MULTISPECIES: hypothetical protein [unclassified Planococcus (in: firmicutes)]MDN7243215.1 hypothetical protein [Planococcus sp. N028]WKA55158.1 hypothetical protein QWY21_01895 [Planococcus sp. N022]
MKNFSFKGRMIYFGVIAAISLAFFALQFYANSQGSPGTGSIILLILWGLMVAFGIGGMIFSIMKRSRQQK